MLIQQVLLLNSYGVNMWLIKAVILVSTIVAAVYLVKIRKAAENEV